MFSAIKKDYDDSNHYGDYHRTKSNDSNTLDIAGKIVHGNYHMICNTWDSFEGGPIAVTNHCFLYRNANIKTVVGMPRFIGGCLDMSFCNISSLQDVHHHIDEIGSEFILYGNLIKSHVLGLMLIPINGMIITGCGNYQHYASIQQSTYVSKSGVYDITDVDAILNKWKNQGRKGVMGAMKELIDLGYEELAQL